MLEIIAGLLLLALFIAHPVGFLVGLAALLAGCVLIAGTVSAAVEWWNSIRAGVNARTLLLLAVWPGVLIGVFYAVIA